MTSKPDNANSPMPPEIADSDAESEDLIDEAEVGLHPAPADTPQNHDPEAQVSPPQVDFDDFIDPTQGLSDIALSQNPSPSSGIGSTEKVLKRLDKVPKELASSTYDSNVNNDSGKALGSCDGSSPLLSRKRGKSAMDQGSAVAEEQTNKKKRAKTYSTKTRNAILQSGDLFADVSLGVPNGKTPRDGGNASHESRLASTGIPDLVQGMPRQRDRPRRVVSLLEQSVMDGNHVSTSTSSMGGYESITIDFRGSGQGLDINANPFGTLSQLSVDGEVAQVGMTQAQDLYGNIEQADTVDPAALQKQDIQRDMMTSPERPTNSAMPLSESLNFNGLAGEIAHEPAHDIDRPKKTPQPDLGDSRSTASPTPASTRRGVSVSTQSVSNITNASSQKIGRKPKASKLSPSSPALEIIVQNLPEPNENHCSMEPPPSHSKHSRRGTLETSSQTSELASNTKRKRKRTKADQAHDQSSTTKNPSSELNLSDEALVGLPKEQYKPRPSRSRSKRSVEDEAPVLAFSQVVKEADDLSEIQVEIETSKPAKNNSKGKKNKVKRAKTSGVALKKSEPMLSEGEEDVLFMDERPAAVKLDLPADLEALIKEEATPNEDNDNDNDSVVKTGGRPEKNIRVEIPPPSDIQRKREEDTPKAEPKKRGRKPKNQTPSAPTPEPLTEPEDEAEAASITNFDERSVLAARDVNVPSLLPTTSNSNDKSKSTGKENGPTPSPTNKPPTTHSPLKSASTVSASRFRVGLSKRQSIPSLLRRVDKTKKAPTKVSTTVKERKVKATDGGSGDENDGMERLGLRDKNGELIEWEF